MAITKDDILEAVGGMTVMELNDLVKAFESRADKDDPMQAQFLNMLAESRKNPIMRSAPAKGK